MKFKFNLKRFRSLPAVARPAYFLIILVLSSFIISRLCLMIKQTKHHVMLESYGLHNESFTEIKMTAELLHRLNSSASSLARTLSVYLNGTELSFVTIQTKVAPTLFLALSVIPQLSQVSYIGLDGLLFSYYSDKDQAFAVYSNTSFSSNWYTQPVNHDTGKLYGDAVASEPMITVNASWIQKALNSSSGHSSLQTGWNKAQDDLFLNTVAMDGRGVISLGFPMKVFIDHFAALDFHGGYFHLAAFDGKVIVQTQIPNNQIVIQNGTIMLQMFKPDGVPIGHDTFSCLSNDGNGEVLPLHPKIVGINYEFYCSILDVAGVQSVYVLAYPRNELVSLVHRNSTLSLMLLALVFAFIFISLCIYIFLTARATNREMFLCAALIKQTEATQQAERKSMNKTKAYAVANHDVRAALAAIRAAIHFCRNGKHCSELAENLVQMENHTNDLLGILNSLLDMSKLEAGKMSLEKEDFNLAQLLEEVVDVFYPLGMTKGVDIVLDPCDGSILKMPHVRGDRIKLKQILCNLINNAIKFTSEGHVSVRAVVKKNSFKKDIIASNHTTALKFLSKFCYKNEDGFNDLDALNRVEENPNEMEFEFEVDDTGKGIPKDKQKSIFEDYVQVKETQAGQEGCGLGLGIVQSLVRVMKGELRIVEKDPGERGTCFRFNIFLSTCEPESPNSEDNPSVGFHQHFAFMSPKPDGSHVIIFLRGEERRKILKRYIEGMNIKVTIIKHVRNFRPELEKIKRKLDISHFNSGKPESGSLDYLSKSASSNSDPEADNGPLSIKDGSDHITPHLGKSYSKGSSGFILFVIDANASSCYSEFENILANFRKDIPKSLCRVVWLADQMMRHSQDRIVPQGDYLISKPLHGSRLMQVLSLLPERKGMSQCNFSKFTTATMVQEARHSTDLHLSKDLNCSGIELDIPSSQPSSLQQTVKHKSDEKGSNKPLNGKKILVVEDVYVLRKVVTVTLQNLGANVEVCTNGKEAFDQVCKALSDQNKEEESNSVPFDYIFMDCEMPVMNGYEATKLIRMEEEHYEVHTPIIALTAHAMPEEASKSIYAGMDYHLTKPLEVEKLLDIIQSIDNK